MPELNSPLARQFTDILSDCEFAIVTLSPENFDMRFIVFTLMLLAWAAAAPLRSEDEAMKKEGRADDPSRGMVRGPGNPLLGLGVCVGRACFSLVCADSTVLSRPAQCDEGRLRDRTAGGLDQRTGRGGRKLPRPSS